MENNAYLSNAEASILDNVMPANQNLRVGKKLQMALSLGVQMGTKWYLDPVNGNDDYDGLSLESAVKTLEVAYAKLTQNKNEVLFVVGGASSISLATTFTWAKSYTHLIGICGELNYGSRCRIGHSANFTTLFTINAVGCMFKNIHWQMGRGSTTNVNCVVLSATAHYNFFDECQFDAPLHATEGGGTQAWRGLVLQGDGSTGCRSLTFNRCTFGQWTVVCASANGALVEFQGIHSGTFFNNCIFLTLTSSSSMKPIKSDVNLGGGYAFVVFSGCKFYCLGTATSVVFGIPTMGYIFVENCLSARHSAWATTTNQIIIMNGYTGNVGAGLGVVQS